MGTLMRRLRRISVGPRAPTPKPARFGPAILSNLDWRTRNTHPTQDGRPDLRRVDFRGCDLSGVDLSDCRLDGAVFDGASLVGTWLRRSDLSGASFVGACLSDATLDAVCAVDATFEGARLDRASLVAANLAFTSFRHACLEAADLSAATLFKADLRNASVEASHRLATDFEDSDTSCVAGRTLRKSEARTIAHACGAPVFADALPHSLSLMNLGGYGAELGLRAVEAAVECDRDQVRGLITTPFGWRVQLVGACAVALGGADAVTIGAVWESIERGSWVSPQLVAVISRCDPQFFERAVSVMTNPTVREKSRAAAAQALLSWFRSRLDPSMERLAIELTNTVHEAAITQRWHARLEELTEPVTSSPRARCAP